MSRGNALYQSYKIPPAHWAKVEHFDSVNMLPLSPVLQSVHIQRMLQKQARTSAHKHQGLFLEQKTRLARVCECVTVPPNITTVHLAGRQGTGQGAYAGAGAGAGAEEGAVT